VLSFNNSLRFISLINFCTSSFEIFFQEICLTYLGSTDDNIELSLVSAVCNFSSDISLFHPKTSFTDIHPLNDLIFSICSSDKEVDKVFIFLRNSTISLGAPNHSLVKNIAKIGVKNLTHIDVNLEIILSIALSIQEDFVALFFSSLKENNDTNLAGNKVSKAAVQ